MLATAAASQLASLQDQIVKTGYQPDLGRAAMLFGARRYAEARTAFQDMQRQASGDDRELADLRVAECDFHLQRYAAARDGVQPVSRTGVAQGGSALLLSVRAARARPARRVRRADAGAGRRFPGDSWAEEALNNLGTHYIVTNEDEAAAQRVRRAATRNSRPAPAPSARPGSMAGGATGTANYASDGQDVRECRGRVPALGLPAVLPLLGGARTRQARARGDGDARFRLVYHDYGSSYYGRLAQRRVERARRVSLRPIARSRPRCSR